MNDSIRLSILAIAMVSVSLGGCATASDRYPSLAIRDAERVSGTFDAPQTTDSAGPEAPSEELLSNVQSLLDDALVSYAEFASAARKAEPIISAANGGVDSNSWASAQVALADLDSLRSSTAISLSELDLAYADATLSYTQREKIVEARDAVVILVSEQDAILARLRGNLSR